MHESLQKAVSRMLSPLVRLLLRHGVSHAEFCNWAKQSYVAEAARHFGMQNKPPSVSRISIVTGINRKEVKRIRELPSDVDTGVSKHNRAVRVVTGWLKDTEFLGDDNTPQVLEYGSSADSFNQLVKKHGGDVPARAMLDELVRVGTVSINDQKVTLLHKGYVPHESESAMLDLFATSATDLLTTLEQNLSDPAQNRLQMSVAYNRVTDEGVARFRELSSHQALQLLRGLDSVLAEHDKDINPEVVGHGENRVGLGIYWIQDQHRESTAND